MSILIKGIEMPKEESITIQILPSGAVYLNSKLAYEAGAVEISTPHGRLIDADKLLEKAFWDYNEATHDYNNFKVVSEYDIADVPTVIEAEGSEE